MANKKYLLNLNFTIPSSPTGFAALFDSASPTSTSKNWYDVTQVPALQSVPPAGDRVTVQPGTFSLGSQQQPLVQPDAIALDCNTSDGIYVRVTPSATFASLTACTLTVCLGRESSHANFASPFLFPNTTVPFTMYILQDGYSEGMEPAGDGSWILYLGQPSNNGIPISNGWKYSFVVCAWCPTTQQSSGSNVDYYFGHEPEMSVTPG